MSTPRSFPKLGGMRIRTGWETNACRLALSPTHLQSSFLSSSRSNSSRAWSLAPLFASCRRASVTRDKVHVHYHALCRRICNSRRIRGQYARRGSLCTSYSASSGSHTSWVDSVKQLLASLHDSARVRHPRHPSCCTLPSNSQLDVQARSHSAIDQRVWKKIGLSKKDSTKHGYFGVSHGAFPENCNPVTSRLG